MSAARDAEARRRANAKKPNKSKPVTGGGAGHSELTDLPSIEGETTPDTGIPAEGGREGRTDDYRGNPTDWKEGAVPSTRPSAPVIGRGGRGRGGRANPPADHTGDSGRDEGVDLPVLDGERKPPANTAPDAEVYTFFLGGVPDSIKDKSKAAVTRLNRLRMLLPDRVTLPKSNAELLELFDADNEAKLDEKYPSTAADYSTLAEKRAYRSARLVLSGRDFPPGHPGSDTEELPMSKLTVMNKFSPDGDIWPYNSNGSRKSDNLKKLSAEGLRLARLVKALRAKQYDGGPDGLAAIERELAADGTKYALGGWEPTFASDSNVFANPGS